MLVLALALLVVASLHVQLYGGEQPGCQGELYLAAQWTSQKVGKLVFDTAVTPRWLETGDRFWYAYQTPQGRNFYLVDPAKKSKALLFDNAKMAAMLTAITRIPYDSQHLPFSTITRFVKKDAAFEFQFAVPADADIVMTKKPDSQAAKKEEVAQTTQTGGTGQRGGRGQGGARGRSSRLPPPGPKRSILNMTWPRERYSSSKTGRSRKQERTGPPSRLTGRPSSSPATTTST